MPAGIPVPPDLSERLPAQARREYCSTLLTRLLPLDQFIPDCYAQWRPLLRDAMGFIAASLSTPRLYPKVAEQLGLPEDTVPQKRLTAFMARMPVLQKLGQTIARNRHLDAGLRAELTLLEDMIRDITTEEVQSRIRTLLGPRLQRHGVVLEDMIHAEASVSAVLGFSWNGAARGRKRGVFKVLKPFIPEHYREELEIVRQLALYLGERSQSTPLANVDFNKIFDDVRCLMEREIDSDNEQANLASARRRFQQVAGVRVPSLIPELCAPGLTAMSFEDGAKITDIYHGDPRRRNRLARRLAEALIAVPLFSAAEQVEFHADPHAGNLYYDESGDELIILDWALTETLDREQRRLITLMLAAVMLRDESLICTSLGYLCGDSNGDLLRDQVRCFIRGLSPLSLPGLEHVLGLLDGLFQAGMVFPTSLLIFRKVLLTLDGILHEMELKLPLENVLGEYLLTGYGAGHTSLPLSNTDLWSLWWSANWMGARVGMQTGARLLRPER